MNGKIFLPKKGSGASGNNRATIKLLAQFGQQNFVEPFQYFEKYSKLLQRPKSLWHQLRKRKIGLMHFLAKQNTVQEYAGRSAELYVNMTEPY